MHPHRILKPTGSFHARVLLPLLCLVLALPASAGPDRGFLKEVEKEFNLEWRGTRGSRKDGPVVWFEHDGTRYSYSLPLRLTRLGTHGAKFHIDKIGYEDTHVSLRMLSDTRSRVELLVFDTTEGGREKLELTQGFLDEVVPSVLARVFAFRSDPTPPPITVNRTSGLIHATTCNHLPDLADQEPFADVVAAQEAGYPLCSVCFSGEVPLQLPKYGLIRRQALEESRLYEIAFPLVEDEGLQEEVQRVGEKMVESLPFDRLGFTYRFRVVQSSIPNAVSYPTGFVYVTSSLLDAIEDPKELEFILAHEISHCELHYNESRVVEELPGLIEMENSYRVSRNREIESDLGSLSCLLAAHPGVSPVGPANSVLRKLQYFSQETPIERSDRWATHLSAPERLQLLATDRFLPCFDPPTFHGRNEMGETIVTVRPLGLTVWPQKSGSMRADAFWNPSTARHQIFLLVEVGDSFDNPLPIEGGKIGSSSNSWSELARVTLYSDLGPGHPAIISGWCFRDPGKLGELSLLELGITDVKSWELVEEP